MGHFPIASYTLEIHAMRFIAKVARWTFMLDSRGQLFHVPLVDLPEASAPATVQRPAA